MKHVFGTLFLILFCFFSYTQESFNGKVLDNTNREPLPGVQIREKNTNNSALSSTDGSFSIELSSDTATLVFSLATYKTLEINIQDYKGSIFFLESVNNDLDQFVLTAEGKEQDKDELGYAVQEIQGDNLSEAPSVNFVDNLAGKVAGVTVSQGATGVGSTSKITIRGESSFTNNNPLFVVDGTPINNNSIVNFTTDAAAGFQEVDFGNGGMEINAEDISSLTVLKGPSAAALYGTRANNGVIVIKTKNGGYKPGLGVSFSTATYVDRPFKLPVFQNKYGQGNSGEFEFVDGLGGGINDNISYSWGPMLDAGILIPQFDSPVTLADGTVVRGGDVAVHGGLPITATPFNSYPNNLRNFYEYGITTVNNVAISNGFENGSFRLSYTDFKSNSFIPGVDLNRNTVFASMNFYPSERLSVHSSLFYIHSNSGNRPSNGYGSENINYSLVAWGPRSLNISAMEDYWQPGLENIQQYSFNYTYFDNPYFLLYENTNSFNRNRVFGNVAAEYDLSDHFSLAFRTGMDNSAEKRYFKRHFSTNRFKNGAYAEQDVSFIEMNTDLRLNYFWKNDKIKLNASIGANRMDQHAVNNQTQTTSLAQPGVFSFNNAASPIEVFQTGGRKRINSVYSLVNIGFKDIVFVNLTGRNDWSSALASETNNAVGFFYPATSVSYLLSNHFELPDMISFLQIRASVAQVGNDTDPYQTSTAYVSQTSFNSQPTFSASNLIPNQNLLPEKTSSYELGAQIELKERISLDLTYYNATTKNQIIALPVPISSGASERVVNGAQVNTQGIEALLSYEIIRKENLKWFTALNFSKNVSTVSDLPEGVDRLTLGYAAVYDNQNQRVWFQVEEGGRIGDMYGTGYLKNENGRFVIGTDGKYIIDDSLKKIGNYNPDFILGWSNSIHYKNWDINFLFDWRQGGELVSRTLSLAAVGGQLIETEDRPENGIIADGQVNVGTDDNPIWEENTTAVSAETYFRQYYDRNHEENNTYNASYFKLRQFSISYTISGSKNNGFFKTGNDLKISLIGRNIFAFSHIPHFDPEQLAVQGNNFVSGVEDMSYPTARSIGLKLNYNF